MKSCFFGANLQEILNCKFDSTNIKSIKHPQTHLLILEQILPRASLHKVRKRVGVLQRVATLGQQGGRIEQILPVDPRAQALHDLLVDARLHPVQRLLLQLQRLGVVLPAFVVVEVLFQRFPGLAKQERRNSQLFNSASSGLEPLTCACTDSCAMFGFSLYREHS